MSRDINPPYKKAIKLLDAFSKYRIPYVIVGGAALVLHGIPRSTLDVDIIIPAKKEIIIKIFKITKHIRLKSKQANILSLIDNPKLIIGQWVSFEDNKKRQLIDIYLEDVEEFKKLKKNALKRKQYKTIFYVASLRDLEKMKKFSGRPIDLADIALIQELKRIKK